AAPRPGHRPPGHRGRPVRLPSRHRRGVGGDPPRAIRRRVGRRPGFLARARQNAPPVRFWCSRGGPALTGRQHLKTHRWGRVTLLAVTAALTAGAVAPGAANAAVGLTITGDDGNPIALGSTINMRNMNPLLGIRSGATDNFNLSVLGPNGAKVA